MRDQWYGDKRDLIKWGVLLRLADKFAARRIIQLAYRRPSKFGQIHIDGQATELPAQVIAHFRDLRMIGGLRTEVPITVFDPPFQNRQRHLASVLSLITAFDDERCIIFLDPDTGLQPLRSNVSMNHVKETEAAAIWSKIKQHDVFVFYQHKTNRNQAEWIEPKRRQLAAALKVRRNFIRIASGKQIADDVVFFFIQSSPPRN
jgi:hypothetical protein